MNETRVAVITGATSGLGQCLYKSFSESYKIINISRTISASEDNIFANLNDLSGLNKKLKEKAINHHLCILNAGLWGVLGQLAKSVTKIFWKL